MSYTCLLRFAPLVTAERVNDPRWQRPGRILYDPGALAMLPDRTSCLLLVDHDPERVVGSVRSFSKMEDVDGPWLVAHATLEQRPEWLRNRETPASFEFVAARQTQDFGCTIARHGWVTEVSLLSPACKPAEPLAKVVGLWEDEVRPEAPQRRAIAVVYDRFDLDTRRWAAAAPRGVIRRPGIGQVLGVR